MSGNADRLFQREGHGIVGNGVDVADHFCGKATVVLEASGGIVDVEFSFDDGLAGVTAFEFGESGKIGADFFREAEEDAAPFLRCARAPWAILESGFGGGYGAVDIVGAGVGDLCDDFLRGGIVDGKRLRGFARDPFTVDVHLVGADFCCDSAGHLFSTSCLPLGLKPELLVA